MDYFQVALARTYLLAFSLNLESVPDSDGQGDYRYLNWSKVKNERFKNSFSWEITCENDKLTFVFHIPMF